MVVLAFVLIGVAVWGLIRAPTGFLPDEDQGYLIVERAFCPTAPRRSAPTRSCNKSQTLAKSVPGVEHVVTVTAFPILDNMAHLANAGVAFVVLDDWDVRGKQKGQDLRSIYQHLSGALCKT